MRTPTVHVSDAEDVVAIQWPGQAGVMVVDCHGVRRRDHYTVPPFARRLIDPAGDEKAEAHAPGREAVAR